MVIPGSATDPFKAPPRAFISYARSDGSRLAADLRQRLQREYPEITLWLDRAQMIGGVGWWKQIADALEHVEILIMVMTPAAMQSNVAANEWRYARQQGVRVCPVMQGTLRPDFAAIPNWMRKAHFYDLDLEWETFIGFLRSAGKVNRVPFMAPDLPARYIERTEHGQAMVGKLLDESGENPRPITLALQGFGGYGKTTTACAICHDEKIVSAFDDGILWVSLGETPNIQGELTKLYAAVTGERPPFIDVDDASLQLAERLDQKNCLLVIDDVWDANHLKPFLRGGFQCARLITTRQLNVVLEAGAERVVVDRMTEAQSMALLSSQLSVPPAHQAKLQALSGRLGSWPLLLKLAGSQLQQRMERGDSLDGAIFHLERALAKRGVVAFDRSDPTARNDAIASTVAASLDLFSCEEQSRCAELAVFRADVSFSLNAVATLWGMDEFDAEELLLRFDNAALVEFDLKTGSIRFHQVLRAYLRSRLGDGKDLHVRLTESWLSHPYELADPYAWTWIGWHLVQGGRSERLRSLLLDFEWLGSRLRHVPVQAILLDFDSLRDDHDIGIVRDALRLAFPALCFDPSQLRIQLVGRLERAHSAAVDALLDKADRLHAKPRLSLAERSLTHPGGALAGILKSSGGAIYALALSPDGRHFASGSEDWTVRLWDLQLGVVIRVFEGHTGTVRAAAFTADGQSLVSASEDRKLIVWDVGSGNPKRILSGHTLAVQGIALSADGKTLASVSEDGTVRRWDMEQGTSSVVYKSQFHQLNCAVLAADARTLFFGGGDWSIKRLNLNDGAVTTYQGHTGIVRSLALTGDETRLLSGADDATLRVWSVIDDTLLQVLNGHTGNVNAIATSADGDIAISGSWDHTLRLWDIKRGHERSLLEGHSGSVQAVALAPAGKQAISGSTDKTIRLWNIDCLPDNRDNRGHKEPVALIALTADGGRTISGTRSGELVVWESQTTESGEMIGVANKGLLPAPATAATSRHKDRVNSLSISADGKLAVTGSRDRTLRLWDVERATCRLVLKGHNREILDAEISADGRRIVSFSKDQTLRLWEAASGRCLRILVAGQDTPLLSSLRTDDAMLEEVTRRPEVDLSDHPLPKETRFTLSADGERVVMGTMNGVAVWTLADGTLLGRETHDLGISVVAVNPKASNAIFGSLFGTLGFWDLEGELALVEGHDGKVLDVVADGKSAISAGQDDTIRLWDIERRAPIGQIIGSFGKTDAVAIAPDGRLAYSVYGDTVIAYDLDTGARLASLSVDHQIRAISVTANGKRLVLGDQSGQVHHLYLET